MIRFEVAALCVALLGHGARAAPVTVATYNVENYCAANRMTEAGYRRDYPKPDAEKAALRRVIIGLHPDVLVLQEMGPRPYLDELRRDLRADGCTYEHSWLAEAADADRHLAILSKLPLSHVTTLAALEFRYFNTVERVKRGVLMATIAATGGDVTLFAVHLKSRYTDRPDDPESAIRRIGEAAAVRDVILRRFPDPGRARFLILGDCNDTRSGKPLARLQQRGAVRISIPLPAADARGETWTYWYRHDDTYARIDFILASPALLPDIAGGRAVIASGEDVNKASDHRPVVVRLNR